MKVFSDLYRVMGRRGAINTAWSCFGQSANKGSQRLCDRDMVRISKPIFRDQCTVPWSKKVDVHSQLMNFDHDLRKLAKAEICASKA